MSTDTHQLRGDSRRRQLEASRAYAAANDLELVEGAELEDIRVSAFRGANVRDGALGQFLRAVKEGVVKPGSFLIVESLESRAGPNGPISLSEHHPGWNKPRHIDR
jgi:hypothetical protein